MVSEPAIGADSSEMELRTRRQASESGIADVLAILLVVIVATLAIVALVDAETSSPKRTSVGAPPAAPAPASLSLASVARRISPAVVEIDAALESGGRSAGSGMLLTSSGQVLTNNHVIAGATAVTLRLRDGRTFPATVVGYDIANDVAVLQAQGASGLPTIELGRSATLTAGQPVVVLDGDRGVKASVRAVTRDVTAGDESDPNGIETRRGVIELAAPMQPIDAGGPVADGQGKVVAMRTEASAGRRFHEETTADISFAVPIDDAWSTVGQINTGRSTATVHIGPRATLGVDVQTAPGGSGGARVVDVQRGGPAAGAGIVANDVLAAVDDVSITSGGDLDAILDSHAPDDSVRLGWFDRKGVYRTATVRLTEGAPA